MARLWGGVGGYAVGFHPDALRDLASSENGEFDWVRYGFERACYGDGKLLPRSLHPAVTLMGDYLKALTMVKNSSFDEEKEWRLMIPRDKIRGDVQFRTGPVGVTPYLSLEFPSDAVVEVIVGPGPHPVERVNGTHQLLERFRMANVPVNPSASSFRP